MRKGKKPSYGKAKKVVARANRIKKRSNLDTFSLTVKSEGTVVPVQGLTVANYIYTTLPLMSSTAAMGVTQNAEYKLFSKLYDHVRINSMVVKFTPKANVLDQYLGQTDNALTVTGDGLVHTVIDRNGSPPTLIEPMSRYSSYKKFDVKKPFTRKYGIKWPKGLWLDSGEEYDDTVTLSHLGALGGIYLYGEDYLEDKGEIFNEPIGQVTVWYNVVFRGKTGAALAYDPETGVMSVQHAASASVATPTELQNIKGSIASTVMTQNATENPADDRMVDTPAPPTLTPSPP